jgi:hypothetical protein
MPIEFEKIMLDADRKVEIMNNSDSSVDVFVEQSVFRVFFLKEVFVIFFAKEVDMLVITLLSPHTW